MENRTFWDQLFPRILAIGIVAYLIYYLGIKGDTLNSLHVWMLVIMLALVLAPMARRLKIFNIVDFESKLNTLQREQQETRSQIGELTNKISNIIDVQVRPAQYQTNVFSLDNVTKIMAELQPPKQLHTPVSTIDKKDPEQIRVDFLSKAEIRRGRAFSILVIAREFQEAILEHKVFNTEVVIGDTFDDKIRHMSKALIDRGVNVLFPFTIMSEKGNHVPSIVSDIDEGLQCVDDFLNVRQKVENREIAVPSDADESLKKIEQTILQIKGAVIFLGSNLIVTDYNLQRKLTQIRNSIDGEASEET